MINKRCKQRQGGFSTPVDGKIICRYCEKEITAGSKICPECGHRRMLLKTELRACGMKIHGEYDDTPVRHNTSSGRGGERQAFFSVDSWEMRDEEERKHGY
ncbi:hypothetical protein M0R72_13890 [Candidatus Pacearchaeota archaeon]|nr:hypothetical protein [Candidatus Pacearchaeota archaeon]